MPLHPASNVHVNSRILGAYRRRAKLAWPQEHLEALFGKVYKNGYHIHVFYPFPHKGGRYAVVYDEDDITRLRQEAEDLKLVMLGTIHTHPGIRQCQHPSVHDRQQALLETAVIEGVCNTYKKEGKMHANIEFYVPAAPLLIVLA